MKNQIKTAVKTRVPDDTNTLKQLQVQFFDAVKQIGKLNAYGLYSTAPVGSFVVVLQSNGQEEVLFGVEDDVNNRPRGLKEGEVMLHNTLTKDYIYLKQDGDIDVYAKENINTKSKNVNITADTAITINCVTVNVNATNINLGEGGQPIARLGDEVTVTVPTHGDCTGTITSASENNTSA